MLNQVLEATLALMILLLALSVSVIVRIRPTTASSTEASADSEAAGPAGTSLLPPDAALWSGPMPGAIAASVPPVSKTGRVVQGRYEARHVRGQPPGQRPPGPAGPPWGPAVPPPGQPQQGSERLT
jgi:hypothetical protein